MVERGFCHISRPKERTFLICRSGKEDTTLIPAARSNRHCWGVTSFSLVLIGDSADVLSHVCIPPFSHCCCILAGSLGLQGTVQRLSHLPLSVGLGRKCLHLVTKLGVQKNFLVGGGARKLIGGERSGASFSPFHCHGNSIQVDPFALGHNLLPWQPLPLWPLCLYKGLILSSFMDVVSTIHSLAMATLTKLSYTASVTKRKRKG